MIIINNYKAGGPGGRRDKLWARAEDSISNLSCQDQDDVRMPNPEDKVSRQ